VNVTLTVPAAALTALAGWCHHDGTGRWISPHHRFVATIRHELLDRLLIVDKRHAAAVLRAFERHYNDQRLHRTPGPTIS
jgi:hypothetical protein